MKKTLEHSKGMSLKTKFGVNFDAELQMLCQAGTVMKKVMCSD